jgi:hypothetical protein
MLIDCKIDLRIWKNEVVLRKNGERVVPISYLIELLEAPLFKTL